MRHLITFLILVFAFTGSVYGETQMVIQNPEGEFSELTFIKGETAYIKVYATISYDDEQKIWGDLKIIENMPEIKNIEVFMDCFGGSVYAGFGIADNFKRVEDKYNLSVWASGVVASAAVVIFASFDNRYASENTFFMVHEASTDPSSFSGVTASQIKIMDDLYEKLLDRYLCILTSRTNKSRAEWEKMIKDTTWFSAEKAKEWDLVKEIK